MKSNFSSIKKRFPALATALLLSCSLVVAAIPSSYTVGNAVEINPDNPNNPDYINKLDSLGRGVNLLRDINVNDTADDLLGRDKFKRLLRDDFSGLKVLNEPDAKCYGEGWTSSSFVSVAKKFGIDLSKKASAGGDFLIGSAKLETGFSIDLDLSKMESHAVEYSVYSYRYYLDSMRLIWDNQGVYNSYAKVTENLDTTAYGTLTNTIPGQNWTPNMVFETYGTHMIISYRRGGEFTNTQTTILKKQDSSVDIDAGVSSSASVGVKDWGGANAKIDIKANSSIKKEDDNYEWETKIMSKGSMAGTLNPSDSESVKAWVEEVKPESAAVLSDGLELVALWDLLPAQYAKRKTELQNYYMDKVAQKGNKLLEKFVYKEVGSSAVQDFSDYEVIYDANDLDGVRNNLNGKYVLANDINLSGMDWTPIGTTASPFRGVFDGNGNTINGLKITSTSRTGIGVFGANNGTIRNVSVNGDITIDQQNDLSYVGGIVGYNNGRVENCQNQVNINTKLSIYKEDISEESGEKEINLMGANGSFTSAKTLAPTDINELQTISDSLVYSSSNPYREFVIDLRGLESTALNTTIFVPASMYALKLIGKEDVTYSGLNFVVGPSAQEACKLNDKKTFYLYLTLENMHFTSTSSDGAISVTGRSLILDSQGNGNSIKDDRIVSNEESAVSTSEALYVVGDADLTISGATGKDGVQGNSGAPGADGVTGEKQVGEDGKMGATGTSGQKGGSALTAKKVNISINGTVTFFGGNGGVGGHGGVGGKGGKGSDGKLDKQIAGRDGGKGGHGGTGGAGGEGGSSIKDCKDIKIYSGTSILQSGFGGTGGTGGTGGQGGNGGTRRWNGTDGSGGAGGTGGTGGQGGKIGVTNIKSEDIQIYNNAKLLVINPGAGTGGAGGNGGYGGYKGGDHNTSGTPQDGKTGDLGSLGQVGNNINDVHKYTIYTPISEYVLIDRQQTWNQAHEASKQFGYDLVSIRSEEEQAIVTELIGMYDPDYSNQYWIGGVRNDQGTDSAKGDNSWYWIDDPNSVFSDEDADGVYTYSDGRVAYTNFHVGEPDDEGEAGRENYLRITENGNGWYDDAGSLFALSIIEKSRGQSDNQVGINSLIVGGISGYNTANGVITNCWNHADLVAEVYSTTQAVGIVSGLVGANEGKVQNSYVDGAVMKLIVNSTSTSKFADGYLTKFAYNLEGSEGIVEGCQYGIKYAEKSENIDILKETHTLHVQASSMAINPKNEFDEWSKNDFDPFKEDINKNYYILSADPENPPQHIIDLKKNWAEDRIHVDSIDKTEFILGASLDEYIVNLTYADSNNTGSRKNSKSYSYKYDFSKEGVTCIYLTYTYHGVKDEKYIPVKVVGTIAVGFEVLKGTELKTTYSYGEELENPTVVKLMSDGSQYIITPEMDNNLTISSNINAKVPGQYVVTVEYLNFEPIECVVTVELAESDPQIIVSSKKVRIGNTAQIDVSIKNNPGIMNAVLSLAYDSDSMTLIGAENGTAFGNSVFTVPGKFFSGCNFVWDGLDVNNVEDGTILTLTFEISENVTVGDICPISIAYVSGDISNSEDKAVDVAIVNGREKIIDYTPGDVNGDGRVNGTDITLIRRYIAGGYNVKITEAVADINGDGRINGTDVSLIRRYLAGGYGVALDEFYVAN